MYKQYCKHHMGPVKMADRPGHGTELSRKQKPNAETNVEEEIMHGTRDHRQKNFDVFTVDEKQPEAHKKSTLQESFLKFRNDRQREMRESRRMKDLQLKCKRDPAQMESLRKKFVEQAKKYYGVPYARKYWPADSPEYKSQLFLDCCGLVRQVLRDLSNEFGFRIGPWNQAYMIDTLPIVVNREEDMKPGDLVFISATYFNPKSKKQRHNMTHVEIWAGDGVKSIGARWNNGKVQTFDSYRFTAKSYHSETYHFRSIDTWLMGICNSFCPEHQWRVSTFDPGLKSVFALEAAAADEAAEESDGEMLDEALIGQTAETTPAPQIVNPEDGEIGKTDMDSRNTPQGTIEISGGSKEYIGEKETEKVEEIESDETPDGTVEIFFGQTTTPSRFDDKDAESRSQKTEMSESTCDGENRNSHADKNYSNSTYSIAVGSVAGKNTQCCERTSAIKETSFDISTEIPNSDDHVILRSALSEASHEETSNQKSGLSVNTTVFTPASPHALSEPSHEETSNQKSGLRVNTTIITQASQHALSEPSHEETSNQNSVLNVNTTIITQASQHALSEPSHEENINRNSVLNDNTTIITQASQQDDIALHEPGINSGYENPAEGSLTGAESNPERSRSWTSEMGAGEGSLIDICGNSIILTKPDEETLRSAGAEHADGDRTTEFDQSVDSSEVCNTYHQADLPCPDSFSPEMQVPSDGEIVNCNVGDHGNRGQDSDFPCDGNKNDTSSSGPDVTGVDYC